MEKWTSPCDLVLSAPPHKPTFCFRPDCLANSARWFLETFPADPYYAIKANPSDHVIDTLWNAGLKKFDVASANECRLIADRYPSAELAFLHPIKNRKAISDAYHAYGVRTFVLDSFDELTKIIEETSNAADLNLIVRVGVSNEGATLPLTGKFGANSTHASKLLRACRPLAARLGVSFHVGSQAMNPTAWATAINDIADVTRQAGVAIDILDIGGGFPSIYNMASPPPAEDYANIISSSIRASSELKDSDLWCEPGRSIVAEAESLLTRIELTKSDALYINDGGYGALYDVVHESWKFPIRAIAGDGRDLGGLVGYQVYGPTCDSADAFPTPVFLPEGLSEGDYIEFGNIGAYGRSLAGTFNGFGDFDTIEVSDNPWPSMFIPQPATKAVTV